MNCFTAILSILLCSLCFSEMPAGNWLDAWWTDGGIFITGPKYSGLIFVADDGETKVLSKSPGAGFGWAMSPDKTMLAFLASGDDGQKTIFVGDFPECNPAPIATGDFGLPFWFSSEILAAYDGTGIMLFDQNGNKTKLNLQTAYMTISTGEYLLWCDSIDVLHIFDLNHRVLLWNKRLFAPIPSPSGEFVLAKELGGEIILVYVAQCEARKLCDGELPRWTENPSGVIFLRQRDDGHNITSSVPMWMPVSTNGIPGKEISLNINLNAIITRIDYDETRGILAVTDDGAVHTIPYNLGR